MDRRDFIKNTGVAAVALGSGAGAASAASERDTVTAPHIASGVRELRLAMPWPQNGRGFDDGARRLSQTIRDLSQDRVRVSILPQQTSAAALAAGDADLYHGSGHDFVAMDPAFAYFAGLPGSGGLRPTYLNAWLMAGGGQSLWDGVAAHYGFKPLLAGHSGARSSLWSTRPITSTDDVAGLRVAAPGLGARVVEKLGAIAVTIAPTDLADALATGRIDAVEWGGTISAYACDLQAAHHCVRPGLTRNGFSSVLAIATKTWESLSPTDQALIAAATSLELSTAVAETLALSRLLREALSASTTFSRSPADVMARAKDAAADVVADIADTSPDARRIAESYAAFRSRLPAARHRATSAPTV